MRLLRKSRWMLLALLLSLVPASSFAGVLISVGVAPPVLPVYEQPPCPQPGWMWTPGYWAYGDDGYYWVPGAWVPAPYEGALWTPPYWGWSGGLYVFHGGYWGPHVGYYGGVNYGFGFMGVGFVGGIWRGHDFVYNTAVVHVNNVYIHNTYVDRTIVERNTIVNDRHVAYSGGPGGINHQATVEERTAMHEQHVGATSVQQQHIQAARSDKSFYANNNGGHPHTMAAERPMGFNNNHAAQSNMRPQTNSFNNNNHGNVNSSGGRPQYQNQPSRQPQYQQPQAHGNSQQPHNESRPAPQHEQSRPQPQHDEKAPKEHR
jgi:WXXGXW repeat (2 copies)